MKSAVKLFLKHPVWANILMGAIMIFGLVSLGNIRSSFFPESESNRINIEVSYPGTSPSEVEQSIAKTIENNLEGVSQIERYVSVSQENFASITVYGRDGADMQKLLSDVKNAVDRTSPWPDGAENPRVYQNEGRTMSIVLGITAEGDLWALKERAERFKDNLMQREGVSQVELQGIPKREIVAEVRESDLKRFQLSYQDIATAVSRANLDISGGKMRTRHEEFIIRSYNKGTSVAAIDSIVVRKDPRGDIIRVRDVAEVREQWEETTNGVYFNGKRAVVLTVSQTTDEDLIHVAEQTYQEIENFNEQYPEAEATILADATVHLKDRIDLLARNGGMGLILVLCVLAFFLNWRVAFWVALGIPISFAGTFIIAEAAGITINVLSLFGMILVIGILVDDAIVVAEQIYQEKERGLSPYEAAWKGTLKVLAPVFSAVLTTIIAFVPFFFFEGMMGKMVWQMALVVASALFFSLVESMLILPAHLSHSKGLDMSQKPKGLRRKIENGYKFLTNRIYGPLLERALKYRLVTFSLLFVLPIMVTLGLVMGGRVQFNPMPDMDRDDMVLNISMRTGAPEKETMDLLLGLEKQIWAFSDSIKKTRTDKKDVVVSIQRMIGFNGFKESGSHAGQLSINLLAGGERNIHSEDLMRALNKKLGRPDRVEKFGFSGGRWGRPISVSLQSHDAEMLKGAADFLVTELNEYVELKDVVDSDVEGYRELLLRLTPKAKALGLTELDVAGQVRNAFYGKEVQRIQRGEDEIRIWVRRHQEERIELGQLDDFKIVTPQGEFPLSEMATYDIDRGRVTIQHIDGKQELRVEAALSSREYASATVMQKIKKESIPKLKERYPNVMIAYEGQSRQNRRFQDSLKRTYIPALIAIVILLMVIFRSYVQPVIILIIIPLGLCSTVWGHYFHGMKLAQLSLIGVVALTGIIINDSIVFLDQINHNLRHGLNVKEAVFRAGKSRLRPILLTTLTTVAGLLPLLLEKSFQAQFLIPMAIAISYGLLFGSVFILFLVPILFSLQNSWRFRMAQLKARITNTPTPPREHVEPAVKELDNQAEIEEAHNA